MTEVERYGFGTLIPADKEWPAGLDDLAPYVLWTRGASMKKRRRGNKR